MRRVAIFLLEENSSSIVKLLKSSDDRLPGFSDLIIISDKLGVFMRNPRDESEVVMVGKWRGSKFHGFDNEVPDFFPERLRNLNGKALKATSFNFPPYNFEVKDSNGDFLYNDGAEVSKD